MPELTAADRRDSILASAKKLYSDGKFKAALAAFKEALLRCPCTQDVLVQSKKLGLSLKEIQISRCHCKDFESVLASNSNPPQLFMYKLAKRPCTCGSDVFHCNVPSHLNALNGIIATYEKLESPAKARQYATLFIITCPRAPEGYLRLAKALRLSDKEKSPDTITRCRRIYRQAIQSVQTYGSNDNPKLKTLASLLRMDIVGSLPPELQLLVLGHLNDTSLCRAMRVSKAWNRFCLDPSLWTILTFRGAHQKLRKGIFNKVVSKRAKGKVKVLSLRGVSKLGIDLLVFGAALKLLVQLESLDMTGLISPEIPEAFNWHTVPSTEIWSSVLFEEAPPSLRTLRFRGFRPMAVSDNWLPPPTIPMSQSLEELRIGQVVNDSPLLRMLYSTVWPKLRRLEMISGPSNTHVSVDLERLCTVTPSLQDLSIRTLHTTGNNNITPSWESLERLELTVKTYGHVILGAASIAALPPFQVPEYLCLPRLRPTLRSLEFPEKAFGVLRAYERIAAAYPLIPPNSRAFPPVMALEQLEHLYMRTPFSVPESEAVDDLAALSWFTELIKPSMTNGTLTSLAITFNPAMQYAFNNVVNKPAIRALSCFDFIDEEHISSGSSCGNTFATWVRGFTNLTALGIFPQRTEICWMHVMKVLANETRIKIIYTDVLTGVWRDEVLKRAEEKGITVIEWLSRIPEEGQPYCPSDILKRLELGHKV
ncbi:hypothetical protein DHEL01_v201576 [Diaporthe helianthi]|uniref:F-box domain-containing protein n=1 Tax=Diaporthe helianthi TaxID=158607 RepID=A0A2P5IC02_DIAHE|nr:hypothetical protein DHEL01_v201576 [Diaporthe helianthi]